MDWEQECGHIDTDILKFVDPKIQKLNTVGQGLQLNSWVRDSLSVRKSSMISVNLQLRPRLVQRLSSNTSVNNPGRNNSGNRRLVRCFFGPLRIFLARFVASSTGNILRTVGGP